MKCINLVTVSVASFVALGIGPAAYADPLPSSVSIQSSTQHASTSTTSQTTSMSSLYSVPMQNNWSNNETISYGAQGGYVVAIQQMLQTDGDYTSSIDGSFGPLTESAVESYQSKNGLSADGVVGPST